MKHVEEDMLQSLVRGKSPGQMASENSLENLKEYQEVNVGTSTQFYLMMRPVLPTIGMSMHVP